MARNKNAREVNYFVKRDPIKRDGSTMYWVHVAGKGPQLIHKKPAGWFAASCYHQTLRDAIVYVLYGV